MGATTAAVLNLGHIRSRTKLIYVGFFAGAVAVLLSLAWGMIDDQPLNLPLLKDAIYNGLLALVAGFIDRPAALHRTPVRRVDRLEPAGTGRRVSSAVAGTGPPGAQHLQPLDHRRLDRRGRRREHPRRGLLVRVGAYFHDIGKMLKPGYFIENQGPDDNRHETLVPAMSTLVIIATSRTAPTWPGSTGCPSRSST